MGSPFRSAVGYLRKVRACIAFGEKAQLLAAEHGLIAQGIGFTIVIQVERILPCLECSPLPSVATQGQCKGGIAEQAHFHPADGRLPLRGQQEVGGFLVIAAPQQAHRGDWYEGPRDLYTPACGGRFMCSDDGMAHILVVLLVHVLAKKTHKGVAGVYPFSV